MALQMSVCIHDNQNTSEKKSVLIGKIFLPRSLTQCYSM